MRLILPTFFCITYANAFVIDGILDEEEWDAAQQISEFTTIVPFNFEDPKYNKKKDFIKQSIVLMLFWLDDNLS